MYDADLLLHWSEFVSEHWCTIHQVLAQATPRFDKFSLMAWFATLAFAEDMDTNIVQTLASFFTMRDMAQISPPRITSFNLSQGTKLKKDTLSQLVRSALQPIHLCPEGRLSALPGETDRVLKQRRQVEFQEKQKLALNRLINALQAQWPCEVPVAPADDGSGELYTYVNVNAAVESVKPVSKSCFSNHLFHEYLGLVERKLKTQAVAPVMMIDSFSNNLSAWKFQYRKGFICTNDVFSGPAPSLVTPSMWDLAGHFPLHAEVKETNSRLATLMQLLEAQAHSRYEKKYVEDLQGSFISLQKRVLDQSLQMNRDGAHKILLGRLSFCKKYVQYVYDAMLSAVVGVKRDGNVSPGRTQDSSRMAAIVGQWPRSSPNFFLQQLTRSRWPKISEDWKHCIVQYGLALTELQRVKRLMSLIASNADFAKELRNVGHTNWDPLEYPESLLLEVESGIMIRDVQESIAREMRNPTFGTNAVMQLNMGEGKSSVIVPVVVAALADGSQLVRVIVGKPQSKQMFQMLVSKLGGLLNRRVYHLPFSRSLRLGKADADAIGRICRECMKEGGVLLVQPEHILSFKLMSLEYLISDKEEAARSLLSTQEFFDKSSRDIVDESDENFSVKFELIYTMGMQQPIELSPERWNCIHQVLEMVRIFGTIVEKEFPLSVEINARRAGGFPRTRILQLDAQQQLIACIAEQICQTGLNGFPIARQPEAVRKAVYRYITVPDLTKDDVDQVEEQGLRGFWADSTKGILLLLRGLMAGGVLSFVFGQKRWRVNYGLDATREPQTKLAVPYRAKDNPTLRSEFSHPDVVIVLTCLCYYYGGLENGDLFLAFEHLLKSDHADTEYRTWVEDAPSLPLPFRQLVGINLKDRSQCIEQVLPPLRFAKSAIDYFLAHVVFPKEMKEFPHKLSASGWDLGQTKTQPTTGFSGTLDSRNTLPLSVQHLDLADQKHTNALVLEHLLQPENSVALMPPREKPSGSDAELLLRKVVKMEPPTRVILDVGAQVLELSNLGVAREWLKMMPDHDQAQAVLFFNDCDELSVLDRQEHIEPLQTSAFAKKLDLCLIFLDEVHTRGTDLKLPEDYRAAVTLGANLTKDRLVQACMRMRKLGRGQSVVFCVPPEIQTKILARKVESEDISISDILNWAISETCTDMRRSMPLWAAQGQRFERQNSLWNEARVGGEMHMSKDHAELFLEDEAQGLEDRYRPRSATDDTSVEQTSLAPNLNLIMERCREFGGLNFNSATLHEEQERELSPEIEQERQVQRPPPVNPAAHHVHRDLMTFVSTGTLISGSPAYKPAFETLHDTSAATQLDVSQFGDGLLVTADFANTVQAVSASDISDVNQRSAQWILTSTTDNSSSNNVVKHMMIISPHEAQELLPDIERSGCVALHVYAARPNLGFRALDDLTLYTVPVGLEKRSLPRRLVIQLNLFAGQLYLRSFYEYVEVCEYLGLAWDKTEAGCVVAPDGFIIKRRNTQEASRSPFTDSPVQFLKVLMTKIRRNCEGIDKTHMGAILDGRLLRRSDFGAPAD